MKVNKWQRYGFTMVESLVSLMALALTVPLINFFSSSIHREDRTTDFYMYLDTLENPRFKNFKVVGPYKIEYQNSVKNDKRMSLVFENHKIIVRGRKEGYSPVLERVSKVDWKYENDKLISNIKMNHRWYHAESKVAYAHKS